MAAHAKLSPSAAARWLRCPGSVALCAKVPRKTSFYADEGSAAHALAEVCLTRGEDAANYLGWWAGQNAQRAGYVVQKRPKEAPGLTIFEVTQDMADNVQVYLDAVREIGAKPLVEARVNLDKFLPGLWGTCDALVRKDGVLHVFDLKYGQGVLVDPEWNPQAMIYALGALVTEDKVVRIIIVQPRHRDGGVMEWEIPADDLYDWAKGTLKPGAERVFELNPGLVPGEKQCRFCDAKSICPALTGKALEAAQVAFKDIEVAPPTWNYTFPDPATMTPEQRAKVLAFSTVFSQWVDAVYADAQSRALAGETVPGYKLVRKRTLRQWGDPQHTEVVLHPHLGEEMYERKLKSPAQIEKMLPKEAKAALAPLIVQPEGDLTLVPEADKRQAVSVNALAAFYDDL